MQRQALSTGPATTARPPSSFGKSLRRFLLALLGLLLLLIVGFLLWPAPFEPIPFVAGEEFPATGALAPNDALRDPTRITLIGEGRLYYPEDVTFDNQGRMYVGNRDQPNQGAGVADVNARIDRVTFHGNGSHTIEEFVKLPGGGPLDMRFDAAGNLIVSSWGQGLIAVDPAGSVRPIVAEGAMIDGRPYGYSDGVAIADDGRIFHTQGATAEWNGSAARHFVANSGPGRLLVTDARSGVTQTLIDELSFGNGIVLAPDESYVLVADQLRYRILRYWLTGDTAGTQDVWSDRLPGFVHNLYRDDQNVIWVAIFQPRNALGDRVRANGFLARQFAKYLLFNPGFGDARNQMLDESQRGAGSVLAMDFNGNVLLSLQNPPMHMNTLSTAVYHDGALYIGTIGGGPVLRYALAERPLPQP